MRAKDCPGCGAVLPISTKECSHCDYQFTSKSMLMSQQSAIDESNTIREKFPFEPERVSTDGVYVVRVGWTQYLAKYKIRNT